MSLSPTFEMSCRRRFASSCLLDGREERRDGRAKRGVNSKTQLLGGLVECKIRSVRPHVTSFDLRSLRLVLGESEVWCTQGRSR